MTGTCSDNSSDTSCLTCGADKHRVYDTSRKTCRCEAGYYDNNLSSEECFACVSGCSSCTGPT